jgi:hypothetical protein
MADLEHYAGLQHLPAYPFPVYTSPSLLELAGGIAERYQRAYRCYSDILNISPQVGLVVLDAADWPRYAAFPTYGTTHYDYPHRVVVTATEPGTFLQPAIDLIQMYAPAHMPDLVSAYGRTDGSIDLASNVELWITHDLGHAFQLDSGYWFPRMWLMEYFADLCSYAYVALNEPDRLPFVETLPRALRAIEARHVRYHTFDEFEAQYRGGDWTGENYMWYHGYLYETARQAYQVAGIQALQRLWQAFVLDDVREISDAELVGLLQRVQPELAGMFQAWPK